MIDDDFNLDRNPPRFVVEFFQGEESLGFVEVKEFFASGEVNECDLLPVAVKSWNELPQNLKDGVTAAIMVKFRGWNDGN